MFTTEHLCVYFWLCSKNLSAVKSLIKSDSSHKYNCSVIAYSIFSLVLCLIWENAVLHKVLLLEVPSTSLLWQNRKDKNGFSSKTQESAFRLVRYLSVCMSVVSDSTFPFLFQLWHTNVLVTATSLPLVKGFQGRIICIEFSPCFL